MQLMSLQDARTLALARRARSAAGVGATPWQTLDGDDAAARRFLVLVTDGERDEDVEVLLDRPLPIEDADRVGDAVEAYALRFVPGRRLSEIHDERLLLFSGAAEGRRAA
ncbi:MAG TPA: hypothetical protein VIL64_05650 [Solirubrobacteraceae bacterium]|jgi:hypothetical protein